LADIAPWQVQIGGWGVVKWALEAAQHDVMVQWISFSLKLSLKKHAQSKCL